MKAKTIKNKWVKYPSYKPSGAEWIGEVPEHWELRNLGQILSPISVKNRSDLTLLSITREKGVIVRGEETDEENHNFIPDDLSNYKLVQTGQFAMNKMKAWQGSYGVSRYDGIVSPAYYVFDIDQQIVPEFFHHAIRSKVYVSFFASASDGVRIGQWDLSKERMKSIPFLLPRVSEQTAIAKFLDDKTAKIDKAINIKQKQIALLKERRQILIHKAVTRGLNPKVKLKDSGVEWIGEIPDHWEVSRLKNHIELLTGFPFKSEKYSEVGIKLARGINVKEGVFNWTETRCWPFIEKHLEAYLLKAGDILVSMDGSKVGKNFCKVKESDLPILLLQRVARLRTKSSLTSNFLFYHIMGRNFLLWVEMTKTDPMVPHIAPSDISNFQITIPPLSEQLYIVEFIETATTKISTAISIKEQEIEKLKEYKASLINSAVTGKIKVS